MPNSLDSATTARILYGRELLVQLKKNLFMGRTVTRKYEQVGKPLFGTVRVPSLNVPPVQKRVKNAVALTPGVVSASYVDITLTEHAVIPMTIDSLDAVISDIDFRTQMAQRAAYNIAAAVETDLASLYYKVGNIAGDNAKELFESATTFAQEANKVLDDFLAPSMPRFGAVTSGGKMSAMSSAAFTQYNTAGENATLITGELGERYGIFWGLCQSLPSHTGGGVAVQWAGAVAIDNGAGYPIGTKTIKLKAFTAAGPALKKGDSFKLGNYYYSLDDDYTGAINKVTVTLAQPEGLKEAVIDGQLITVGEGIETGAVQLVYHPDAFALATAPMDDDRPGTQSDIIVDEQTGLSIRVTYSYQHLAFAHVLTTELLYGFQCVRPELAVRIATKS